MEEKIETFKSQRGADILVYNDHMYNLDYNRDGSQRWRCHNRSCKGAIFFKGDSFIIEKKVDHSHPPFQI